MNPLLKNILIFFGVLLSISLLFGSINLDQSSAKQVSLGEVISNIQADKVKTVDVAGDKLVVTLKDNTKVTARKEPNVDWTTLAKNYGIAPEKLVTVTGTVKDTATSQLWVSTLIQILLPVLLFGGFIWIMFRQAQGQNGRAMSFGQVQ